MSTKRKQIKTIAYSAPSSAENKKGVISQQKITHPDVRPSGMVSGGMFGPDKELKKDIFKSYKTQADKILKDPKLNPAGKARVSSTADSSTSLLGNRTTRVNVGYAPDPSARSRGANVRANKERGTQSSTQRKVIK
jgi:hypothetical protein